MPTPSTNPPAGGVTPDGLSHPTKRTSDPIANLSTKVGWVRVLVASAIALLAAGAFAALYASQFATSEEVTKSLKDHESCDSPHPVIRRDLAGVEQRLIRMETLQQQSASKVDRIEDKLDRVIEMYSTTGRWGNYPPLQPSSPNLPVGGVL